MYEGALTSVDTRVGGTDYFQVQVGLHQGSSLSPFLFTILVDAMTSSIQGEVMWCMLFVDDIVLVGDSSSSLSSRLEVWRDALESKGFRLSRAKTEYVNFNFGDPSGTGPKV